MTIPLGERALKMVVYDDLKKLMIAESVGRKLNFKDNYQKDPMKRPFKKMTI